MSLGHRFLQIPFFFCLLACGHVRAGQADQKSTAKPITIVIDPGHGGKAESGSQRERTLSSSNNATSPGGLLEKDLTLELGVLIAKKINESDAASKKQLSAILTRTRDTNPDFQARAKMAADIGAAVFVSIHFNATEPKAKKQSGTLALVRQKKLNPAYAADVAFAESLIKATHATLQKYLPKSKAMEVGDDHHLHNGQGSNLFHQIEKLMPQARPRACFLEVEFMDNPEVETAILTSKKAEVFEKLAEALAAEIVTQALAISPKQERKSDEPK